MSRWSWNKLRGKLLKPKMGKRKSERQDEMVPIQPRTEFLKQHFGSDDRPKIFDKILNFAKNLLQGATGLLRSNKVSMAEGAITMLSNDNSPGTGEAGDADPTPEVRVSWCQVGLTCVVVPKELIRCVRQRGTSFNTDTGSHNGKRRKLFCFFAKLCGMWDLGFLTRIEPTSPCNGSAES